MIVIVSKDADFSAVVAEQVERELALVCQTVRNEDEAKLLMDKAELVVTSEPGKFPVPVVAVKTVPVRMAQLLSDIRAQLQSPTGGEVVMLGYYVFSARQKQLAHKTSGKSVSLTDKEGQLLKTLADAGKKGANKEAILKEVWGIEQDMDTHTLETHIYRLRAKLRELGELSIAATATGYKLELA